MRKVWIAVFFAFGVIVAGYPDTYKWIGVDGRWDDKTNWRNDTKKLDGESCPGAGDVVQFWPGKSVSVAIDGDYSVHRLELMAGTAGKPDAVILTGDGSLTVGEADGRAGTTTLSYLNVHAYRCLKIFGIELSVVSGVQYIFHFAEMVVGEGSIYRPRQGYMIKNGSRLVLDGGQILGLANGGGRIDMEDDWDDKGKDQNRAYVDIRDGVFKTYFRVAKGCFRMSGGYFAPIPPGALSTVFEDSALVDVKITGGEVFFKDSIKERLVKNRGVFPEGAVLTLGSNCVLRNLGTAENPDLPLNGGEVRGNGKFVASTNFNITGGGYLTFGKGMSLSPGADDPIDHVVMDVDSLVLGANFARPYQQGGVGDVTGTNLHIHFPREVVVAATNADWYVSGLKTVMHIKKGLTIDTADRADAAVGRQITLRCPTFSYGSYLRTVGCGTGLSSLWSDVGDRLSELSVGAGSTCKFEMQYNKTLKTDLLSVDAGATLGVIARKGAAFYEAEDFLFGDNARILSSVSVGEHKDPIVPGFIGGPLAIGAFNDETGPQIVFTKENLAETWDARFVNGSLAFCRKDCDLATSAFAANRWIGSVDGSFEKESNWSGSEVPQGTNTTAVFDGIKNTSVTIPDAGADLYSVRFLDMAGPFVLSGGRLGFESRLYNREVKSAIYSSSAFPVVINNNVGRSWTGGNHAVVAVCSAGGGYIALKGNVDAYARFEARGDVRILGETTAWNVIMKSIDGTYARPSKITVYGGAKLKATNQTIDFAGPQGGFEVKENGVFSVEGTKYGYTTYGNGVAQRVDGLFDVQAPLCGTVGHWFVGSGRVKFKDTGSQATADYTIRLGEKVRFSAETFFKPIEVEGEPTLCSENGWEYAAGPLALPKGCVLTIDTQDPDTAEGYDCTFASAISGSGSLKVTGAGSLRLTAENSIGGAVTLDGGTLVVSKSQNFGSFSGGGVLTLDASGGEVPQLNVAGGFDLSVVTLGFNGLTEKASKGWVTLASFPAGSVLPALPGVLSDHWKVRYVQGENGLRLLQARYRTGIEIIVR